LYCFAKQSRLIKTDDFSSVFNFRKRVSAQYLIIHYQMQRSDIPRLGMVVAKKVANRSVDRNYMRRVLRELFRHEKSLLQPVDLVIRVQKKFTRHDFITVQKEFKQLMSKLNARLPVPNDSVSSIN
jgi:ribonuclease P protein component